MTDTWAPHDYQRGAVTRAVSQERFALFADPGLGKTAMTLEAFRLLRGSLEVSRMLVVAPLRPAYSVWPAEAKKWEQFRDLRVHVLHGKGLRLDVDADVYVTNPESLKWLAGQDWDWPEMLAIDELTKFKHYTSGRAKHLRQIFTKSRHGLPWRIGLTGTPAPNGLEDLFGQIMALDDGKRLGTELKDFRCNFGFYPEADGRGFYKWKEGTQTSQLMSNALRDLVLRLNARDHLKLPEFVEVDVPVRLPPKARTLYTQLRKEMVVRLETGHVAALSPGSLTAKCRQVANGSVYLSDDGMIAEVDKDGRPINAKRSEVIHTAKAEALADLIEEAGRQPMLVVYEHKHELPVIREHVARVTGSIPPYLGGGVSGAEGDAIVGAWNAGKLPVLIVHPQSAAHGLNLQAGGNLICWYSLTWDLELYEQLNKRLHRQGQKADTVFVYRLLAERTVDQTVARAITRKARTQEELLTALREESDE